MPIGISWTLDPLAPATEEPVDQGGTIGRDIRFDDDFVVGNAGDYLTVDDDDALNQWARICLATNPGEYKHDPQFGVGVPSFVKKPDTATNRSILRQRIVANFLRDDRFEAVPDVAFERVTLVGGQSALRITPTIVRNRKQQRLRPFTFTERS